MVMPRQNPGKLVKRGVKASKTMGFIIQRVDGNPIQERVFGPVSLNCPCRNPFSPERWTPVICQEIEPDHPGGPGGGRNSGANGNALLPLRAYENSKRPKGFLGKEVMKEQS